MSVYPTLIILAASLVGSFCAPPQTCKMLKPRKIELTSPTFTGKWYLLRWATQYEPYRQEFGQVDNTFILISPVVQMNKTLIKGYMRIGNNCISEMEAYRLSNNGLEFTCEPRPYMVFRVLNTKIPNCLITHTQEKRQGKMYHTIALYGRNPNGLENGRKIFEDQILCVGMKKEKIVVPPRKQDECDPQSTEDAV
ncbi:alpha-1-acid glycoprotein-like [Hemiscyllium ocellatum]|uniref:alpha-1-acid glycoprotein-like n=1 Tax=Hemiscyllium ocellatum TaxID=170820 RepID=UPI0029670E04|nr:alpha-1-acid glycoprotein-like [Hemiscyllium ocellatum]